MIDNQFTIPAPCWNGTVAFYDPETQTFPTWTRIQVGGGNAISQKGVEHNRTLQMGQFMAMLDATMKYSQTQVVGDWTAVDSIKRRSLYRLGDEGGEAHWETEITLNENADAGHFNPYNQLILAAWNQVSFMRRPGGTMDAQEEHTPSDEEVYSWIPIIVQLKFTWPDAQGESDFDWDRY